MSASNMQTSAIIKQTSATNMQTSATIKQIPTATMQKPDTTKLSTAVNLQAPAATKQMSATTAQAPTSTKQMSTATARAPAATTQKPFTTKPLPAVNLQAPATTKQTSTATARAPAATTQKPVTTKLSPAVNVKAYTVNSLPPLALDFKIFACCTTKGPKTPAKPLNYLEDLAHTVDKRFVLAYSVDFLPLATPSWEETLVNLDFLLAWCCPYLKTIRTNKSNVAISMTNNSSELQIHRTSSSQSNGPAEIRLKHSSPPGSVPQKFSSSQLDSVP
ncbi:hypothetical protein DSO57_1014557 [Entomophthora muscae]|uniref:Uncharacterized protein n=1 Tax=Entomophthora muscae TaxID=34485 RepID=A0ACC2SUJ2_9FUNG|nr:hypothetical protein DSO57_1014557 [Entomophthora muscae]